MHLGYLWFTIAVLVIIGGIVGGGTFTIVLVPVGLIAIVGPLAAHALGIKRMWGTDNPDSAEIRRRAARNHRAAQAGPQDPDEFVSSRQRQQ